MAKGRKHALTLEEVISRTAVDAAKVAQRVGEDIRGDILRLSRDLEIHRRADDREKVEKAIRARIKRMNADLSRVMDVALGKAVKDANAETGLAVKYSADYTREILAMVQEQQGENLASVYSRKMEQSIIAALRNATVGTIQEAAVAGLSYGEQKKLMQERWEAACKGLGEAKFIDSGGHEWDSRDYFAMNVRTNAMRVYNDVLAGNVAKDGGDLVQVTRHGDPGCKQCFPWEGRILSLTGKTKGYPTYEECRAAGCFHPNCTHSIQTVDELIDADEIELQRGKESPDDADDPMKAAFDLDVARKQRDGMGKDEAEAAVRRERLEAAARFGMPVEGAERVVQGLTDGEVAALTDGVKVPKFSMAKRHEEPRFTPGSAGGHVVMPRGDLTAEALKELPGVEKRLAEPKKAETKLEPEEESRRETVEQMIERFKAEGRAVPKTIESLVENEKDADRVLRDFFTEQGGDYAAFERNYRKMMLDAFESGSFALRITEGNLKKVFGSHFMNTFETGGKTSWRKHDAVMHKARDTISRVMFGFGNSLAPEEHEKFGYLASKDPAQDSSQSVLGLYGGVVVRFRKDRVCATFTVGDSLNVGARYAEEKSTAEPTDFMSAMRLNQAHIAARQSASLVTDPRPPSMLELAHGERNEEVNVSDQYGGEFRATVQKGLPETARMISKNPVEVDPSRLETFTRTELKSKMASYVELQYHGEVGKQDIESVSFQDMASYKKLGRAVMAEMRDLGITVYVAGEKVE